MTQVVYVNGRGGAWFGAPLEKAERGFAALRAGLDRLAQSEEMTLEDYQALLEDRRRVRETYAALKDHCDVCVTLAASGPAPLGLDSTGDSTFAVPSSLLGAPALSLPVLAAEGLPLGLQMIGFTDDDAAMFSAAGAILPLFDDDRSS